MYFSNHNSVTKYISAEWRIVMNNRGFDYFALTIAIIGAINWGLIGFFKFDLVAFLLVI